uniref:Squalene cyclase N-terminal domain-containing protein n=1 Tax=Lactuca sativa TaxID=4236 RepID=A0A9R1XIS6_LACSA|nr:hypothetical protein LSAT_V11C400209710 [Lactuca sativa]
MWKLKIAEGGSPWLRTTNDHVGRQFWEFDPTLGSPEELADIEKARQTFHENRFKKKHSSDLLMRIQFAKENSESSVFPPKVDIKNDEDITEDKVTNVLRRAIGFHSTLQADDGHWPGDIGGPMFLLPGLNRDGGWGLHIEGHSTMFGSALNYVTLRLLGEGCNDGEGAMEKGRKWILDHGGATLITSWGKFWLSLFKIHCCAFQVGNHIDSQVKLPPSAPTYSPATKAEKTNVTSESEIWSRLDASVLQWIYNTISNALLHTILKPNTTTSQACYEGVAMLIQKTTPLLDFYEVRSKLIMEESRKAHQATTAATSPNIGAHTTGLTASTTPTDPNNIDNNSRFKQQQSDFTTSHGRGRGRGAHGRGRSNNNMG